MTKKTHRQRFTLIEMLVVIGIASLLFALLGPAFQNMIRGNAVERHASGLKLGMERARAMAISSRRYVAILLPYAVTTATLPHYKYQRGGFRFGYVVQNASGAYEFDGFTEDTEWKNQVDDAFLTALSHLKDANLSAEKPLENFTKEPTGFSSLLYNVANVPYEQGNTCTCRAIIFTPYGNVLYSGDYTEIYLYITGVDVENCLKLRLNKLSGKVEYVE